jgi:hypothetical protein
MPTKNIAFKSRRLTLRCLARGVGQVADVQLSCFAPAEALHRLDAFGGQREQALRVDQESAAFLSERDVLLGAVQQAHADFFLEILNPARERGLRQMERRRRPGKIQCVRHGDEIPQMTEFHKLRVCGFPTDKQPIHSLKALPLTAITFVNPLMSGTGATPGRSVCYARPGESPTRHGALPLRILNPFAWR